MKTTVDIADDLLKRSQRLAKREGLTLRAVLEDGLRLVLKGRQTPRSRKFHFPTFGEGGLSREFEGADWRTIRGAIYGVDAREER